jgi:hypothetical protein
VGQLEEEGEAGSAKEVGSWPKRRKEGGELGQEEEVGL